MKNKWLLVLIVALVAVLIAAVVAVIALGGKNEDVNQDAGITTTSENVSSGSGETDEVTLTYEEYLAMTEDEQQAFRDSFKEPGGYVAWYWAAKDAYDESQDKIILDADNPVIDFSDLVGEGEKED